MVRVKPVTHLVIARQQALHRFWEAREPSWQNTAKKEKYLAGLASRRL
jgi:hypothetical protein